MLIFIRNTAGAGFVVKTRNVSITNYMFKNVMMGLVLGPEGSEGVI